MIIIMGWWQIVINCSMIVRYIKKKKILYMNELEIVLKNRNFQKKSFNSDADS